MLWSCRKQYVPCAISNPLPCERLAPHLDHLNNFWFWHNPFREAWTRKLLPCPFQYCPMLTLSCLMLFPLKTTLLMTSTFFLLNFSNVETTGISRWRSFLSFCKPFFYTSDVYVSHFTGLIPQTTVNSILIYSILIFSHENLQYFVADEQRIQQNFIVPLYRFLL